MAAPIPCKYSNCPAFKIDKSWMGYCSIHHMVACDPAMMEKARKGQLSAGLKEFAAAVDRHLYPKGY